MKTNIIINKDIIDVYATSIINLIASGKDLDKKKIEKITETLLYIEDNNEGGEGFQRLALRAQGLVCAYLNGEAWATKTAAVEALANIVVAKYEA